MTSEKTELAIARADRVMRALDDRDGAVRDAARRERQRLNAGLGRALVRAGIGVGIVSLATIGVGLVVPIGMFGFLAAVGLSFSSWWEAIRGCPQRPAQSSCTTPQRAPGP